MNEQQKKVRFGVFDAIIIVFLVACIIAAGFAFIFKRDNGEQGGVEATKQEYIVSFKCYNFPKYMADRLNEGDEFFMNDNKTFGTLRATPNQTPAQYYVTKEDGAYYITSAPDEQTQNQNVDKTKKDVSGEFIVEGVRDQSTKEFLVIDDNVKVIPGGNYTIYNENIAISIMVTDVQPLSAETNK